MIITYLADYQGYDKNTFVFLTMPGRMTLKLYADDICSLMTEKEIINKLERLKHKRFHVALYCTGDGYYVKRRMIPETKDMVFSLYDNITNNRYLDVDYPISKIIPSYVNGKKILRMRKILLEVEHGFPA